MRLTLISLPLLLLLGLTSCLPSTPPYPHKPAALIRQEADSMSQNLEAYIEGWLDGINPSEVPDSLIPPGIIDADSFYLVHPDSVSWQDTWGYRPAKPVDLDSLYNGVPDPNATYYLLGPSLAPFGSKVHLEGEFPHCRFFSIQMSPSLDGEQYCQDRYFGPTEVSIVDADIDPLPGHTNPFRLGANRNDTNRSYHVTFDLAIGNAVTLSNGQFAPPYRAPGNTRIGGLIQYQGPWGENGGFDGLTPGSGEWNMGALWVRIFAPDRNQGPFGGVDLPKLYYELPDGRTYFLGANFDPMVERANGTMPAQETYTPPNEFIDASKGWVKSFGILRSILEGVSQANGWNHPDSLARIEDIDLGVTGRSQYAAAPRNYEPSATGNNHVNYVGRFLRVDTGYVAVLTGKMPLFPKTRNGEATMQSGQCRYWSITGYDNDPFSPRPGSAVNAIMDDEVMVDQNGNFMILYSRPGDKPSNATTSNGISWVNWGPTMNQGLVIRFLSVAQGWDFDKTPDEIHLPYAGSSYASPTYDNTLLYQNWHKGWLGCFLPRIHYMKRSEFEALGNGFDVTEIPIWVHDKNEIGVGDAVNLPITASSVFDTSAVYAPGNANDLDVTSSWGSQYLTTSNPEWLTIDLGTVRKISAVKISWVFLAHATGYAIQVSNDNVNWTSIFNENNGDGLIDVVDHLQASGRYIRLFMTQPAVVSYGVNFFEVYTPGEGCLNSPLVGIAAEPITPEITAFPNPTSGSLEIQSDNVRLETIRIWDASGKLILAMPFRQNLELSSLPSGLYFLEVEGEGQVYVQKIMVE